jgi:7-cyano-7-deazaguanine synthase in queuosine biosynthesis
MPERLILCGRARRTGRDSILRLDLSGRLQNITLRLADISRKLLQNVSGPLIDLIEIAAYVYCADQAISRGGEAQRAMGADWRRAFRFVIPVRNPNHWNNPKVSEPLRATLSFLSEDEYVFEFEKAHDPIPFQDYLEFGEDSSTAFKADEVILFSGGLDSLAGAIEELSTTEKRIALVSHHSSSKIFDYQKRLIADLNKRFPKRLIYLPVLMTRQQDMLPAPEYTHRSRSFLYAALACAVARLFGKGQVRFFENGVLSVNLPISEQVVGSRATRTTHPLALERFREFFSAAIGKPIDLENPFIWKTKAEVIRSIVDHGCGGLIKHTVSCTRTYDITKLHTHCGCCSQCLDRRFAVLAANAAEHDPVDMYKVELLTGERERDDDKTMAESYVRSALELRDMGELAFFGRFSGETARALTCFPSLSADDVGRQVFNLHQRHARAIGDVLMAAVKTHSAELVNRSLPTSSLLMMTVLPGAALVIPAIGKRADSLQAWIEAVEAAPEAAGHGPHERPRRGKSKPALERARGAINELYPRGAPGQAVEPNANLCRRVSENLKQAGLPDVSDDTILRAAGRRK